MVSLPITHKRQSREYELVIDTYRKLCKKPKIAKQKSRNYFNSTEHRRYQSEVYFYFFYISWKILIYVLVIITVTFVIFKLNLKLFTYRIPVQRTVVSLLWMLHSFSENYSVRLYPNLSSTLGRVISRRPRDKQRGKGPKEVQEQGSGRRRTVAVTSGEPRPWPRRGVSRAADRGSGTSRECRGEVGVDLRQEWRLGEIGGSCGWFDSLIWNSHLGENIEHTSRGLVS